MKDIIFNVHDRIRVINVPNELGPPNNGMRGFIDSTETKGGYYNIIILSREDGLVKPIKIGGGACSKYNLEIDNGDDLNDVVNTILYQRELKNNEIIAKNYLKKMFDDEE